MKALKIIIADNESIIRMDLREMLEQAGYEIIGEATNGEEVIELARKFRPDLILLDIHMPKLDGIEAAKILSKEKIAPIILLTAFHQSEIVNQAKQAGVMAYLVKPIQESQLFPTIEIALSCWEDRQMLEHDLEKAKDDLEVRKSLDRAKGILMQAYSISESEAYRRIQKYSMSKRLTLKETADIILNSKLAFSIHGKK